MKAWPKFLCFGFLLFFLWLNREVIFAASNEAEKVDFVDVQLSISGKIYEGLQERIELSITRVGEKVLLGQSVALLKENKEAVKTVILNVFSKVLIGFRLESIELFLGEHSKIIIHLTSIPPIISEFKVNLDMKGMNSEIINVMSDITLRVEDELNQVFTGLPVAAVTWSEGIFNSVINYLLEREFPGFDSRFSIQAGITTQLNLVLIPQEPLVSTVSIHYSTTNIPVWVVKSKSKKLEDKFKILQGIPVNFLVHYQPRLEKILRDYFNNSNELQQFGFIFKLGIEPNINTRVKLMVDSQKFLTKVEGRYFVNNDRYYGGIQVYLGYKTPDFETYTRYCWGGHENGIFKIGIGFPIEENFTGGLEYEFEHLYKQIWLHYQFERGDYLGLKLGLEQSPNEAVIGIYLNKYTNIELVNYLNTFGFQVMFHY